MVSATQCGIDSENGSLHSGVRSATAGAERQSSEPAAPNNINERKSPRSDTWDGRDSEDGGEWRELGKLLHVWQTRLSLA